MLAAVLECAAMTIAARSRRNTIFLEDATVVSVDPFPDGQFIMRLSAAQCATRARPGSFVHLTCAPDMPMRRPLSIMRVDAETGWVDVLFKTIGSGLQALAGRQPGEKISVLGPIGQPFCPSPERPYTLLVGGGVGIPPMVFLAEQLANRSDTNWHPLVLMGSEIPFPFPAATSEIEVTGLDPELRATMPLMEELRIPARLASLADIPGCFKGYVTELAARWLDAQTSEVIAQTELFACGPTPMLAAIAKVAAEFDVPCQVSLEEFMACAVGGCAGCTVAVHEPEGIQMKRVCVDGPVFDAAKIFPAGP